jgi:hypothetical protein
MVKARRIMLDKRSVVIAVDCRQEYLVYLDPKVVITEAARLLLFPVQPREQEVKRDIFKSDQPPKRIIWDLIHRPSDVISATIASSIVYGKGIKV